MIPHMSAPASSSDAAAQHWALDKRVNVGFLIGLVIVAFVQASTFVWYASKFDSRQTFMEDVQGHQTSELDRLVNDISSRSERISTLEAQEKTTEVLLSRIDSKLDNLIAYNLRPPTKTKDEAP